MQYRFIMANVSNGLSSADDLNKFLKNNKQWKLWNIVSLSGTNVVCVLEGPDEKSPGDNNSGGALTEPALLTENVLAFKKAA